MSVRFARMVALQTARAILHWGKDLPEADRLSAALSYGHAMAVLYAVFKRGGGVGGRKGTAPGPAAGPHEGTTLRWGMVEMVRLPDGLRARACRELHDPRRAMRAMAELGDPEDVLEWALQRVRDVSGRSPAVLENDREFYEKVYLPVRDLAP